MKNLLVLAVVLLTAFSSDLAAQKQKIGHLDATKILEQLPERDSLQVVLENEYKKAQQEIMDAQTDFQEAYNEFVTKSQDGTFSQSRIQMEQGNLQNMQAGLEAFQQNKQQELMDYETKLMKPIEDKIKKAIKKVAEENGFAYIIDTSTNVALYYDGGENVLNLVLKELGITVTE